MRRWAATAAEMEDIRVGIVAALRTAGPGGMSSGETLLIRLGLPQAKVRTQLRRLRDEYGVVHSTGRGPETRWHASFATLRDHVLWILDPGEWWYLVDLAEALLGERLGALPDVLEGLIREGLIERDGVRVRRPVGV